MMRLVLKSQRNRKARRVHDVIVTTADRVLFLRSEVETGFNKNLAEEETDKSGSKETPAAFRFSLSCRRRNNSTGAPILNAVEIKIITDTSPNESATVRQGCIKKLVANVGMQRKKNHRLLLNVGLRI